MLQKIAYLLVAITVLFGCGAPLEDDPAEEATTEGAITTSDLFSASEVFGQRELVGSVESHVDPFSGELRMLHQDLTIPGPAGLDLAVVRHFRSHRIHSPRTTLGTLGVGWELHLGQLVGLSLCDGARQARRLLLPDGRVELLTPLDSGGDFISGGNFRGRCEAGISVVYSPGGVRHAFDYVGAGKRWTSEIKDVNGNWLRVSYQVRVGSACDPHDCERVTVVAPYQVWSSDGRQVNFTMGGGGSTVPALSSMATPDSDQFGTARRWLFSYERRLDGLPRLSRVQRPDGSSWRYASCGATSASGDGSTLSCTERLIVTRPEGGRTTYRYDTSGPQRDWGVVVRKEQQIGTWRYSYGGTTTTVAGPTRREVHVHWGDDTVNGQAWLRGKPRYSRIESTGGQVLEERSYSWTPRRLSGRSVRVDGFPWSTISTRRADGDTYTPLLARLVVRRDGTTYSTSHSSFDSYGHPQRSYETGPSGSRTSSSAYFNRVALGNPSTWIVGKLARRVVGGVTLLSTSYDTRGRPYRTERLGVVTNFWYWSTGDVYLVSDQLGRYSLLSSYYRGVPRRVTRPDGKVETVTVNRSGTLRSKTNARGYTTSLRYDGLNRPTRIDFPAYGDAVISYPSPRVTRVTRGRRR